MKQVLGFWLVMAAIVGGLFAIVAGSILALSPFMGPKAVGFLWCGLILVGIVVFFSWMILDDAKFQRRLKVRRSLQDVLDYYSLHR